MIAFLTAAPLWLSALVLVGLTTAIAMIGPIVVRRFVTFEKLSINNEVAGFKFATVGVLYAVLLAFAIILVWEKYNDADATVAKEAGAIATLYHLSQGLGDAPGGAFRGALTQYLKSAIADEWPSMDRGQKSVVTQAALDNLYTTLLNVAPAGNTALMSEIFYQLDVTTQARRARLLASEGAVPGVIWAVLFMGAVVTFTFTLFFGSENLRAQTLMTGLLAILIFSQMLIIVAIDRPFSGTVKVTPEALSDVLRDFGLPKPCVSSGNCNSSE